MASGKKVALNTLIISNVEAPTAWLLKSNLILATFPYPYVFLKKRKKETFVIIMV